eukprot:CAMPEP_0197311126 /NCGR_PEP_ID=MMETSP0891-20130614/9643_1 /TAXON_ID=44058 ORGANISM="Aureoumbra lagunensis, Strain CCMP1510" /NCGR_SAMPLE_ID=MMETSP0891 /ASSEMBLY_ACC=CAM_ASM_000534 /LENGTH=426 /DNA_ID=CAMNT_0042797089 /DNA_START=160 /DNA_END=1440 /DNA_ORIENTATION=+
MDPSIPHKIELLGMQLVAWKSNEGWCVFEDACPHRLGPLSEGVVQTDGTLLCSYHAWGFDGSGSCVHLPYSDENKRQRHKNNPRAQCNAFPTLELDGFLFVYPQAGAYLEASTVQVPRIRTALGEDVATASQTSIWKIPAGVRDFPCGFDAMIENTLDPAHFCAAHHGTLGNRYKDPAPYQMNLLSKNKNGSFIVHGDFGGVEFEPPCLVTFRPNYNAMPFGNSLTISTYCVPTKPGWVRPLATVLLDTKERSLQNTLAERALAIFMSPITPHWFAHIASSFVLHQDAALLYYQYRTLRYKQHNSSSYHDLAFVPNSVDIGVSNFRRWFEANSGPTWACEDVIPPQGTEDIFDFWHAHTKHCAYCQQAFFNLETAKYTAVVTFAAAAAWMPDGPDRAITTTAAATIALALHGFTRLFVRYEYHHRL